MSETQKNREVRIKTPLGEDKVLLRDMTMTEELGRLFTIDLELMSSQEDIKFEDLLGQNVTIELDLITGGKRYFNGHVTRLSQSGNSGGFAVYQATIRPWLWFLTRTSDCRIFQNKTVLEIVKEVCSDLGFTDIEEILSGKNKYRQWEYCVQYRETDFNFVSRLLEQEGIYYYFVHTEKSHTLVLSNDYASHKPLSGAEEIPYYPPNETAVREEEHISSWFVSKQIQPGVYELNEFDFEKPPNLTNPQFPEPLITRWTAKSFVEKEHVRSKYQIYDYPGEYVETPHGENYAQMRIEELHTQYEQAQGQSDVRVLGTGHLFKLKEYPREDQNREYLIVSATHSIHSDDYGSGGGSGAVYSNSFSVIESKTPYRPARTTPKPIIQGAQTALVVGAKDEEIDTDRYGRVKLQFHWDRYGNYDENSSCWVRVAQLWAGKKWGGIHIPRIGQEVIVEFLEGDPDRPIITGRVYNADQMPPYDLPTNKTQSGIKSRSSKKGTGKNFNEIRMEDKKGEEQLYIHAEKNQNNIVENDETRVIGNDRTMTVGNDESIDINRDRSTNIWENDRLYVEKERELHVGDNFIQEVHNGRYIRIVKEQDSYFEVKGFVREDFRNSKKTDIKGDLHVDVKGSIKEESGKTIDISATEKITFKVGGSKIIIDMSGITISAPKIDIKASGFVLIKGSLVKVN